MVPSICYSHYVCSSVSLWSLPLCPFNCHPTSSSVPSWPRGRFPQSRSCRSLQFSVSSFHILYPVNSWLYRSPADCLFCLHSQASFPVLCIKLGAAINSSSLISCTLQRCPIFIFIHLLSHLSPTFPTPLKPSLLLPSLPVHQEFIYLLPHIHTIKGGHHVRSLSFLSLLPTPASKCGFASASEVTVEESEGVLSKANPYPCKMAQTGAVPLVEGCSHIPVTPQGRAQGRNTPDSFLLCPFLLLVLPTDWIQLEARGQGSPLIRSIKFLSPRTQGRGDKVKSRSRRPKETILLFQS